MTRRRLTQASLTAGLVIAWSAVGISSDAAPQPASDSGQARAAAVDASRGAKRIGGCKIGAHQGYLVQRHVWLRYRGRARCQGGISFMKLTIQLFESGKSQAVAQIQHKKGKNGGLRDAGAFHCDLGHHTYHVKVTLNATDNLGNAATGDTSTGEIGCYRDHSTGLYDVICSYRRHDKVRNCDASFYVRRHHHHHRYIKYFYNAKSHRGPGSDYSRTRISATRCCVVPR